MLKYVLLLTVAIGTDEPHGGTLYTWALDTGLTGAECIAALEAATPTADMMGAILACERDHAAHHGAD